MLRLLWLAPLVSIPWWGAERLVLPSQASQSQASQASGEVAQAESVPREGAQGEAQESPPERKAESVEGDDQRADLIYGADREWISFPVRLEVTRDYLEFLLVNPHGGVHESLFSTELDAQVINTAVLAMGLKPGENVRWRALMGDPLDLKGVGVQGPRQPGQIASRDQYEVLVPNGDALYLYAAWREGEESFFFRVEDLIRDLDRGRTLRRHAFVYLGSFMKPAGPDRPPRFAASMEGNLINIAFFKKGSALFTTAVVECDKQSNWLANSWLLPEQGAGMRLVFSKKPLTEAPASVHALLPQLPAMQAEPAEGPR